MRQHELTEQAEADAAARRQGEQRLAIELKGRRALQHVSTRMIQEGSPESEPADVHEAILYAAVIIMESDAAVLQVLDGEPERVKTLAARGLAPEVAGLFDVTRGESKSVCVAARRGGQRIIVPDVESCEFMSGSADLEVCRHAGIRAVQATPLVSRSGRFLGMLSTHWRQTCSPGESALHLLDVLARQAADLIERAQSEAALRESRAQMAIVTAELNHRVKNMLAVIQAVARQTLRHSPDMAAFQRSFESRLQAIGAAHSLLTSAEWRGASIEQIVASEVGARAVEGQVSSGGPPITLRPKAALAMHMVIHELTTNAVKYGGLKDESGSIDVRWNVEPSDAGGAPAFTLDWTERSAQPASSPSHPIPAPPTAAGGTASGFGTRLIKQLVEYELHGKVQQEFLAEGFRCRIRGPLPAV